MKGLQLKSVGRNLFLIIHPEGIPQQEWLGKFYCLALDLGGQFQIEEIEF